MLSQQIILNFVTAYEDKIAREIVIDLKKIRKQYFRGFFLIDFMSILPVNYVEQAMNAGAGQDTGGGGDLKTLKILRLIRLTRLLRLARVKRLLKTYVIDAACFVHTCRRLIGLSLIAGTRRC